jgi:hypothetical protein
MESVQSIESLMLANLLDVFNERSSKSRAAAISKNYSTDIIFYELERVYRGHAEVNLCVKLLLDKSPGWVFKPDGAVSVNHNLGMLSWQFGPEGLEPVVKGTDIAIVEDGKIKILYVVLGKKSVVSDTT